MPRIAIALSLLLLWITPVHASWTFETVDVGNVGMYSSIKTGPADQVHIAHFAGSLGHLKYAHFDGSTWTNETVDGQYLTGHLPSLDLDSSGIPHIAYIYYTGRAIRYASPADSAWTLDQFESDDDLEWDTSMKLDASGHPHVSYQDDSYGTQDLAYAFNDGTSWTTTSVDTPGHCGRGSSIGLDSAGHPWISYYDETNIRLKVAHFDGTRWIVETIDDVQLIGFNFRTAIAVDQLDRIHVVYGAYIYDGTDWRGRLKYALHDAAGWHVSTIEEGAPNCDFRLPAIAINAANRPEISYLIYFNSQPIGPYLKYARFDGLLWRIEVVETDGIADSNYSVGIAIDIQGRPHLSFCYYSTLRHAVGSAPADIEMPGGATTALRLWTPYPNPTRGPATIGFELPNTSDAVLSLYDISGRCIATLARGAYGPGVHAVRIDRSLPLGTYLCRLAAGGSVAATKLVVR